MSNPQPYVVTELPDGALDKREDETWGQHATRLIAIARGFLTDPTKAKYHDRLLSSIQAMEEQLHFWAVLAEIAREDEDERRL